MDSAKEDDGHIGYDLRENPKKSLKFSSSKHDASACPSTQESQCEICGKDFGSLKALYGHMRHHSRREKKRIQCKECGKALLSAKSLSNHMRVHSEKLRACNESVAVKDLVLKRKRSKRKRYNFNASSLTSSLNESLSLAEIDQAVGQAALCLMMLSRGIGNFGEFYAVGEFSDNDSATSEVISLNKKMRILTNEGGCFVSNGYRCLMKKPRLEKLDSIVLYEKEEDECNEVYSGAESDEGKKAKSEVSIEKFYNNGELEIPKADDKPGSGLGDPEIEKESSEVLMEEDELDDESGMGIMTSTSSKKVGFNACDAELGRDSSCKAMCSSTCDYGVLDDTWNKGEIKCKTCNKIFCSRRALGGHQRMHRIKRSSMPVKTKKLELLDQTTIFSETDAGSKLVKLQCIENLKDKENKEHTCRICLKVFVKGQALGGHQRAHFAKNSGTNLEEIAVEKDYSDVSNDLDLAEETDGDAGSEPWLVEHKHEPPGSFAPTE